MVTRRISGPRTVTKDVMHPRPRTVRTVALATGLGVALGLAPLVPATAASSSPSHGAAAVDGANLVIDEAYLKGGSANAPFTHKFVELYNPTGAAISLAGWSLQYRAATSSAVSGVGALAGTVPAGGSFLVQLGSNGTTGAALPEADAVLGLNPSGTTGTLVLADQAAGVTLPSGASSVGVDGVVDLLGYGTSNTYETAVAATSGANSVPNALVRTGHVDTDDNAADFTVSDVVTPVNSAGGAPVDPEEPADPEPTDPPAPAVEASIAEIQGTGDASPLAGQVVRTRGVVTATYPTGGLDGYVVQTPGTGGALDLGTHAASDAVFVFSSATASSVSVGDHVELTGEVTEYYGLTELTIADASGLVQLDASEVDAPEAAAVAWPATDRERESLESMIVAPQGDFTVSDVYTTNQYGEVALAAGTGPLLQPTEVGRPGSAEAAAATADNAARAVTLDDGSSVNFFTAAAQAVPLPWLSPETPVTVGAPVTFSEPVVVDFRNGIWKLQPTGRVTGDTPAAELPASFGVVREATPAEVGGDVSIASFNVLNYFPTTGDQLSGCTYYRDRAGVPLTVNGGCDARGAATQESFERQQSKIVSAVNGLDADVVSLEEIENSARFGQDRDAAVSTLVDALNADLGADEWSYVPSPASVPTNEDVIRLAFIYKVGTIETVGGSTILTDAPAFSNARQPLAQAFRPVAAADSDDATFVAIANHFKSKGSGSGADADLGDGQGASNASRVNQAEALVAFSERVQQAAGTDLAFLLGDFNAYSQEDPIEVLRDAGYTDLGSTETDEYSYVFGGLSGSLDHVLASPAAAEAVTAVDIWNINSGESVGLEYSRFNYNAVQLFQEGPFRASDHDPVHVGLSLIAEEDPTDPGTGPSDPGHGGGAHPLPPVVQAVVAVVTAVVSWLTKLFGWRWR
jgi:5'-nucleotidase